MRKQIMESNQRESDGQTKFAKMQSESSNLAEMLKTQNREIALQVQTKDHELQKATIQVSNLTQIKTQLTQQLDLAQAQCNQLKELVKESEVDQPMEPDTNTEELKSLVLAQKQDHKIELQKRDDMIKKLQGLFTSVQTKQGAREIEYESKMKELSDKHTNFIKKLKQNLADVTQENDNLKGQMRGMTQQFDAVREEKDRISATWDIQDQLFKSGEIGQTDLKVNADSNLISQLQNRVNAVQHKSKESEMERDRLAKKLEIDQKDFYDKKKAFQDEIERLKQQVASLEESRKLLEEGLEEQKRANLDAARKNPQANSDRATEKELILLDRAQKAEKQEEEMRNERLVAIDKQK